MKTIRNRKLFASFVVAIMLLLNISPALAGGQRETSGDKGKFHGRVEVIFTKWITDFPNMAGLVSGDVGGGTAEEFGALVHVEIARWTKVIKEAGIKINS